MSVLHTAYVIDAPAVISDEVGGETLAINLNSGAYFVIPPAALDVWRAVSSGVPAGRLLDGPGDPRAGALELFVSQVVSCGLLREAAEAADLDRVVVWSAEGLDVQEHTDMADLLGLDPIHDADEAVGWPVARPVAE